MQAMLSATEAGRTILRRSTGAPLAAPPVGTAQRKQQTIRLFMEAGRLSRTRSISEQSLALAVHIATPTRATTPMRTAMGTATIADML